MVITIRRSVPDGMSELLDLIRICSVETIESIQKWREAMVRDSPWIRLGVECTVLGVRSRLSVACILQGKKVPFMWNGINYLLKMTSDVDFMDENRTIHYWLGYPVFRNPFIVPLPLEQLPPIEQSPQRGHSQSAPEDPRKGPNLASYTAPDFNTLGPGRVVEPEQMELFVRLKRKEVDVPRMLSVIGDLDMVRVREAEKVLLIEETQHMRYGTVDGPEAA